MQHNPELGLVQGSGFRFQALNIPANLLGETQTALQLRLGRPMDGQMMTTQCD